MYLLPQIKSVYHYEARLGRSQDLSLPATYCSRKGGRLGFIISMKLSALSRIMGRADRGSFDAVATLSLRFVMSRTPGIVSTYPLRSHSC